MKKLTHDCYTVRYSKVQVVLEEGHHGAHSELLLKGLRSGLVLVAPGPSLESLGQFLLEPTVLWEDRLDEANQTPKAKYAGLTAECLNTG